MDAKSSTANIPSMPSCSTPKGNQLQAQQQQWVQFISNDILDDLGSRFIINVPENERQNLIRICFQIELAHWFYLDFYCEGQQKKCGIKQFAFHMFQRIPFLTPHSPHVDKIIEVWKQYKLSVPTYGAILLSEDLKNVLLVQSYFSKVWGFPKGKINENEDPVHCAIREVYEETGFDIKNLITPMQYIELVINYQYTRLYLVRGVPVSTIFNPRTRNEIRCCKWFPIESLPVTKNDSFVKDNLSMTGNSFFIILPFIQRLKKWVEKVKNGAQVSGNNGSPVFGSTGKQNSKLFENKVGNVNNRQRQRHKSMGDIQQQRSKSIDSQNYATPEQIPKHAGTNNVIQDIVVDPKAPENMVSNKKAYNKKHSTPESAAPVALAGGRTQIKRKLFGSLAEDKPYHMNSSSSLNTFDECQAWASFKLDYSKFL